MFANMTSNRKRLASKLQSKAYRDSFVSSHLFTNIASQIFSLREKKGWTQENLADETAMGQSRISVMENPNYAQFTIKTLLRIASAFDVALVVRFVRHSEALDWAENLSQSDLAPSSFDEDKGLFAVQQDPVVAGVAEMFEFGRASDVKSLADWHRRVKPLGGEFSDEPIFKKVPQGPGARGILPWQSPSGGAGRRQSGFGRQ